MAEKVAEMFSCDPDAEVLTATDVSEAVQEWVDYFDGPLPETVTVYGFARRELPPTEKLAENILYDVLERLNDEYGDPDGLRGDGRTPEMVEAAHAFADVIRCKYWVWACEHASEETVKVSDYVAEPADA
jgi:hypothetical protein